MSLILIGLRRIVEAQKKHCKQWKVFLIQRRQESDHFKFMKYIVIELKKQDNAKIETLNLFSDNNIYN